MSSPKTDIDQLSKDLRSGVVKGLLVYKQNEENEEELAAYVLYFTLVTSTFGRVLILEDIYIREQFRRAGLGRLLFGELSKIASQQQSPFIEWTVLRSNTKAIAFYDHLEGSENQSNSPEAVYWWRSEQRAFEEIIQKASKLQIIVPKVPVIVLDGEKVSIQKAKELSGNWMSLTAGGSNLAGSAYSKGINELTQAFICRSLGAVSVEQLETNEVVGMALFSRKGYSSWLGQYLYIDQIFVHPMFRRKGIGTALTAELAKIARTQQLKHIKWKASDQKEKSAQPFFNAMGAHKLDEDLIYRWHYGNSTHCSESSRHGLGNEFD